MYKLDLENIPNQELNFNIDETVYTLRLKSTSNGLFADIKIDGKYATKALLVSNLAFLIPYKYLVSSGNLIFYSNAHEDPDYRKFNISQFIYYLEKDELAELMKDANFR